MKRFLAVSLVLAVLSPVAFATGAAEVKDEAAAGSGERKLMNYATLAEYQQKTGKKITKFSEAPALAELVKAGKLPPVERRLPEEPAVVQPLYGIGRYGGEMRSSTASPKIEGADISTVHLQPLFRLSEDLQTVIPNVAKKWDLSSDFKTLVVYLRKGMKWSDGEPFTSDDIMFWYDDVLSNKEITSVMPRQWAPGGKLVEVTKIDETTVKFQFAAPYPAVLDIMAIWNDPYLPKHYLKKYHIKYNPDANALAKAEGYDTWWKAFAFHADTGSTETQQDVNIPGLAQWQLKRVDTNGTKYFERNPYFWMIDTAGNQLPYIDREIGVVYENADLIDLAVVAGELSFASVHLVLKNYPIYKEGEAKGGYTTLLWQDGRGSEWIYNFNMTHKDPVLRKIFGDVRFREAMSIAINRKELNDVLFFGKGVVRQATITPVASFYEDWMGKSWAEYDPDRANKLLDEMGLTQRDKDGFRLRPDGKTLTVVIPYYPVTGPVEKISELVAEYWKKVGVSASSRSHDRAYYNQRQNANELDVSANPMGGSSEFAMRTAPDRYRPPWGGGAIPWWQWYSSGGKTGEEPPAEVKELFSLLEQFQVSKPGTEPYKKLGRQIIKINVDNVYTIGTVGQSPHPLIFKNTLGNVPSGDFVAKTPCWVWDYRFYFTWQPEQWYFKK